MDAAPPWRSRRLIVTEHGIPSQARASWGQSHQRSRRSHDLKGTVGKASRRAVRPERRSRRCRKARGATGVRSLNQPLTWTRKGEGTRAWCEKAGEAPVPGARGRSGRSSMVKAGLLEPKSWRFSARLTGAKGTDACVGCGTDIRPVSAELPPKPAHREWEATYWGPTEEPRRRCNQGIT